MSDLFISYSRKDADFVRTLSDALVAAGREPWLDAADIPPTAEWLEEILRAIDAAQAFVFVISPDSLASEICAIELSQAEDRNKRLVPIVRRDPAEAKVPESLSKLNWVFARESNDFDAALETLLEALDTDLDWVRVHTRTVVHSQEWRRRDHDKSLLLRERDLKEVQAWFARATEFGKPQPTAHQLHYIEVSAKAQRNRSLWRNGALASIVTVGAVALWFAIGQRASDAVAQARALAANAQQAQLGDTRELTGSAFNATQSLATADTAEGRAAWRQAFRRLGGPPAQVLPTSANVLDLAYDGRSKHLAVAAADGTVELYGEDRGQPIRRLVVSGAARAIALDSKSSRIAIGAGSEVTIWDYQSERLIATLQDQAEEVRDLAFSPNGALLAVASADYAVRLFDTATRDAAPAELRADDRALAVAFNPVERDQLATGGLALELWRISDGTMTWQRDGDETAHALAFDPRGRRLFASGTLWSLAGMGPKGGQVDVSAAGRLDAGRADYRAAAFSGDGKLIATAARGDPAVRVWNSASGAEIARLVHARDVNAVVFAAGHVITGGEHVAVWSPDTWRGEGMAVPGATTAAFDASGDWLVTGDAFGIVRTFRLEGATWHERASAQFPEPIRLAEFGPADEVVVVAGDGELVIGERDGLRTTSRHSLGESQAAHAGALRLERWLVQVAGSMVYAMDLSNGHITDPLDAQHDVSHIALAANGSMLAAWTEVEFVRGKGIIHPSAVLVFSLDNGARLARRSLRAQDNDRQFYNAPGYDADRDASKELEGRQELVEQAITSWDKQPLAGSNERRQSRDGRWSITFDERLGGALLVPQRIADMIELGCRRLAYPGAGESPESSTAGACEQPKP